MPGGTLPEGELQDIVLGPAPEPQIPPDNTSVPQDDK